jgi:hypothetical protein
LQRAADPFRFVTASYLTRIGNQVATTLLQLRDSLELCSEDSIFYHTFQSLGRHHFLTEGFSNDFAQWALTSCNCAELAERLASLDIRDYISLNDLRGDLSHCVAVYCENNPQEAKRAAFEPLYFCESVEEEIPLGIECWTLEEFCNHLQQAGHASLQFHFLTSRLRLHLRTNDFSQWFAKELKLETLSKLTERIDIYTNTLESARTRILLLAKEAMRQ